MSSLDAWTTASDIDCVAQPSHTEAARTRSAMSKDYRRHTHAGPVRVHRRANPDIKVHAPLG